MKRGQIVALDPIPAKVEPRASDLNIAALAERNGGIYRPSDHLEAARQQIERISGDTQAFVRSHVRRLEALRRAGHVERVHADEWKIPADIAERGLSYTPSQSGEYVAGRLAGVATLASGRFAMMEDGLGFQLVPWQPALEKQIGKHISGVARDDGGIEWTFGRKRGLGL